MIIIQTTVSDDKNAKELIQFLLATNKIACGTFHAIQSSYKWKDEIVNEPEVEVSIYTRESLLIEVVDIVKQRHHYKIPKITVIEPVYTLPEYKEWLQNSTT